MRQNIGLLARERSVRGERTPNSNTDNLNPVAALQAENQRLKSLTDNPPQEIVTVSDLHLGGGRSTSTGRFSRTENFLCDEAFNRFLKYVKPSPQKLLFLNGDTFDFVRMPHCPQSEAEFQEWSSFLECIGINKSPAQLRQAISRKERRFGLGTDDYKSVWKLLQIAQGHDEFFRALAAWINGGGLLLLSKGNHDLELYWPAVRNALAALLQREGAKVDATSERLFYCDDSLRIGNVYFEHGHRYDPEQRIVGGPVLETSPDQLNLPLGIFVNRYLINPLEKLKPFLGSVRPAERILWMLLRRYPIEAIRVLFRSLSFLRRAFQTSRVRDFFWYAVYIGSIFLPFLILFMVAGIFIFVRSPGKIFANHQLSTVLGIIGLLAPYLAAALREFVRWLGRKQGPQIGEDAMAEGIYKTVQKIQFPSVRQIYAVMGHTHDQDVQLLPDLNGARVLYLNTGTWIPVWPDDRPDLEGQVLFPFIYFHREARGEYRHDYLQWRNDRGEPAESYILEPPQNNGR